MKTEQEFLISQEFREPESKVWNETYKMAGQQTGRASGYPGASCTRLGTSFTTVLGQRILEDTSPKILSESLGKGPWASAFFKSPLNDSNVQPGMKSLI